MVETHARVCPMHAGKHPDDHVPRKLEGPQGDVSQRAPSAVEASST